MLLDSFGVVGFGPFKKRWSVRVGELRGLVAVVGPNGAGKSTFLELALPGALYRQTPTRGSLGDLAVARDACLDVTVVNGARWTLRHLVDGQSKKAEAVVLQDGAPVPEVQSAKVRDFDAFAAKHWPAPEVLLSTIFGAQGAGGFLAAKPGERKAILLRVLGVEQLERKAEQARERAKAIKAQLETTGARLADERARGGNAVELEQQLESARRDAARAEERATRLQAELEAALAETQHIDALAAENRTRMAARDAIDARIAEARAKLTDLQERLKNNRAVLANGPAIRAAVERVASLQRELADAVAAAAAAEAASRETLVPWLDVNERIAAALGRAQRAAARLRDSELVDKAVKLLPTLRDEQAALEGEVARTIAELEQVQSARLDSADERIAGLRATIGVGIDLASEESPHADIAGALSDGRQRDDAAVEAAERVPQRMVELQERLASARDRLSVAQRRLSDAAQLASRKDDVVGAADEQAAAEAEAKRLSEGYAAAGVEAQAKAHAADELRARVRTLRAELGELQPTADRARHLDTAEARIAELEPQVVALKEQVEGLTAERRGVEVLNELPPLPPVASLRGELDGARSVGATALRTAAALETRLEQARASATRQAELEQQEQSLLSELADWTRLASDLGRDGLQALEIDAAGPELTAITNDILHRAHGPRFTIRVDTQRASADGKKMLEGCEVLVLDTVQGREAAGETFSGGERVILSEALALAITVLACRRSGLTDVTLVRDESGAALDSANARVYVAMLRHAIDLIGARHCLLVSHVPEVQELCDHRIEVGA